MRFYQSREVILDVQCDFIHLKTLVIKQQPIIIESFLFNEIIFKFINANYLVYYIFTRIIVFFLKKNK